MGVGKGDLSTLISVARSVPEDVLTAIGPAPAAGTAALDAAGRAHQGCRARRAHGPDGDPAFQAKGTDERFAAIFAALAPKQERKPKAQVWKDDRGRKLARVERSADRVALAFDETLEPGLADYVLDRLPEILAAYRQSKG